MIFDTRCRAVINRDGRVMRSGQPPRGFDLGRPDHHPSQRPRQQQTDEQLSVLTVDLDPVRRAARCLARRDHLHVDADPDRRAIQPAPGRPRLITPTHRTRSPSSHATGSCTPGSNRARVSSPVIASIAGSCVDRAWTSGPTHVIVPVMAGPPHSYGVSLSHSPARHISRGAFGQSTPAVNPATGDPRPRPRV